MKKNLKRIVEFVHRIISSRGYGLIAIILFILLGLIFTNFLTRGAYHDESHFFEVIKLFSEGNLIQISRDYPEVTPPLFYILYSGWGGIMGLNLPMLRVFSILISLDFLFLLAILLKSGEKGTKFWPFLLSILLFNPYFIGSSFLVYTDILGLFFLILFVFGILRENNIFLFLGCLGALLTRQYLVFALASGGLFLVWRFIFLKEKKAFFSIALMGVSAIPLIWLIGVWEGLAPPSGLEKWNPEEGFAFHPAFLTAYLSFFPIYLFPALLVAPLRFKRGHLLVAGLALAWYFIFPVEASLAAKSQMGIETIGWTHKILIMILGEGWILDLVLAFSAAFGVVWLAELFHNHWKSKERGVQDFLFLVVILFFMVMPFSYQVWEKYLIALIPIVLLILSERPNPIKK
jgi:hypothetical protein